MINQDNNIDYKRAKVFEKFQPKPGKLLDQLREVLRYHHYSIRTEEAYVHWVLQFIKFNGKRHPKEMGKFEIESFLSYLASEQQVSSSTQNIAFHAILFLYEQVLHLPIKEKISPIRSKKKKRLPTVLSQEEIQKFLKKVPDSYQLLFRLMYGCGLRLLELVRLRVLDLDFENAQIMVRNAKGEKDRSTFFPASLHMPMQNHLRKRKILHEQDLKEGLGEVFLPDALAKKYPKAASSFKWQYVFVSKSISVDPRSKIKRRHHLHETSLQKVVVTAAAEAGFRKRVTCHTLRHSFATHLLENGINIRMVQELMGHEDVRTTQIYTHVMNKDFKNIKSPLDNI